MNFKRRRTTSITNRPINFRIYNVYFIAIKSGRMIGLYLQAYRLHQVGMGTGQCTNVTNKRIQLQKYETQYELEKHKI